MTPDRALVEQIGDLLWSIFPHEAKKIIFEGMFYPSFHECGPEWFDATGTRLGPDFDDDRVDAANDELAKLVIQLQSTPPFASEPFTQIRYALDEDRKADVKFAYIPEWDSWPGIYMKGVSDIPEDEVEDSPVPHADWRKCKARRQKEPY